MGKRREGMLQSLTSDRALGCLLGGMLGVLMSCCLGIALLTLSDEEVQVSGSPPPPRYDVEAVIGQDYLNRTFLDGTVDLPQPLPLTEGRIDVQPGGRIDFAVKAEVGPFRPLIRGTAVLRFTEAGRLEVVPVDVRIGRLSIRRFIPEDVLDGLNRDINTQLTRHIGAVNIRLVGVTTDESSLHFYLVSGDEDLEPEGGGSPES